MAAQNETQTSSIKQLLILLRDEIENDTYNWKVTQFMCVLSDRLYENLFFTGSEYKKLTDYLMKNDPFNAGDIFPWFPKGLKQPRINLLNEHIQLQDNLQNQPS